MLKRAVITGITGQDGSYLAELLLNKKYEVIGIYRRTSQPNFSKLANCVANKRFHLIEGDLTDEGFLYRLLNDYEVDEFYNLGAQSHVKTSFEQRLHRLVPDFDAVNADPKWIAWLNEFDPLIRGPRKLVAQEAFNRGDAEAVADYVKLFREVTAPVEPAPQVTEELERQIQPSRSASSTQTASPKGKTYSTADITKMFNKVAQLGNQGKVDEARKLEAEIDAAYMEGRVTG